jgi:hypothetical protein
MFRWAAAVVGVIALAPLGPAVAQSSDPFQSNPGPAAPAARPAPAPRPRAPAAREPEFEQPTVAAPVPAAPARPPTLVGTWRGQAWQWPVTLVIQADDGQTVSLQFIGSRLIGGRPMELPPNAYTVRRGPDGSFTINQATGSALENVHPCGSDICGTYYQRDSDARASVLFIRSQ